ncbi:Rho GTPase activation protein [Gloeopeniophorella convolvens]|nr:Rho GTPase activation protein [Gloeopeniophorella convolvens]
MRPPAAAPGAGAYGETGEGAGVVFARPLKESLRYASVQVSTADAAGRLYVWGYIPVVVAKCGLLLKENATEVEGTFRVNGSARRMRELQTVFETPPRYGKSLDWKTEHYTTHDVASVFRRFLTQLPEPVIPHDLYFPFRDAIAKRPYNQDVVIATYKRLIRSMPHPNQYLLLYVLDLLSVFARKADKNLMTAQNLAVIFRPGLMSHPNHELTPAEHQLSQDVLEFLIAHQDWFMLDTPRPPPPRAASDDSAEGWAVVEHPHPHPHAHAPLGIARSRTLPSARKGREIKAAPGAGAEGAAREQRERGREHERGRGEAPGAAVLRKARRASAQPG